MSRVYTYYLVNVPGDLFDDMESILDYAIGYAREHAADYRIPANWSSRLISGELGDFELSIRVLRVSH